MHRIFALALFAAFCLLAQPAKADVAMTFYSHDFGSKFPHAFFTVKGKLDSNGKAVDGSYGFTATSVSPAILMGSVKGAVQTPKPSYIAKSNAHFTVRLSDAEYAKVMAMVGRWQALPGKSYNLGKRNCVHFIMDAISIAGLKLNRQTKYKKKPKSFLNEVMSLNPGLSL
ncbi:hypothetical protein ACFOWX_08225 [Sphingorhabdus arenilitoris]|uniref:DUF4105 domain-containing protein n=1 Tax=Sphingorhabdus arenilitoris TaxID=1490041 RepID=A0ABV8RHP8_9SPHN